VITPDDIRARYPEFGDPPTDATIQIYIDDAVSELSGAEWGDDYDGGLSALTAHFLSLHLMQQGGGGTSGPAKNVSARKVGDVSVNFDTAGGIAGDGLYNYYSTTPYGQEYWRLVTLLGVGMLTV